MPAGRPDPIRVSDLPENLQIRLNGQQKCVPRGTSIADLVRESRLPVDQVAVEVNGRVVKTAAYDRLLEEGDVVEIVTFVGGG